VNGIFRATAGETHCLAILRRLARPTARTRVTERAVPRVPRGTRREEVSSRFERIEFTRLRDRASDNRAAFNQAPILTVDLSVLLRRTQENEERQREREREREGAIFGSR